MQFGQRTAGTQMVPMLQIPGQAEASHRHLHQYWLKGFVLSRFSITFPEEILKAPVHCCKEEYRRAPHSTHHQ